MGCFRVELHTPMGHLLPSIEYDGHRCFLGEAGQEFLVAVTSYGGKWQSSNKWSCEVSLLVDGQSLGYSKIFWHHKIPRESTCMFEGWLHHAGDSTTYTRFKFGACRPGQAAATVGSPDDLQAGKIELRVVQVMETGEHKQEPLPASAAGPSSGADTQKLPDGKKWFLAPGLRAEAGSTCAVATSWNTTVLKKVGELPSLHVRYDSSEALYLRKALNPRFAPHRPILRMSANPAIAAAGAEPEADFAPAAGISEAARSSRQDARVKREVAGVKRELGAGRSGGDEDYVPKSATAADRIDLTEEPVRPMCVNGRRVAADELVVCDLCHDVDGTPVPKWQVNKKQHVKVELCTPK